MPSRHCEFLLGLLIFAALLYTFWGAFNLPEVEVSHATGKCVRIVYADGKTGSCDKMPERFDRVWVE